MSRSSPRDPPSAIKHGSRTKTLKRRVRFSDELSMDPAPKWKMTKKIVRRLWWSGQEIFDIQCQARTISEFYVEFRPDYQSTVVRVIASCAKKNASVECLRTDQAITDISEASARGLENTVVSLLHKKRQYTNGCLLKLQKRLNTLPSGQRNRMLALQYARHCRYASLFARLLADGDSMKAF